MDTGNVAARFEAGVDLYFNNFGHRIARELTHHAWLFRSIAEFIDPQLVVHELNVPNRDLSRFGNIGYSAGALSFDLAVTRSELDLRSWKSLTPGWNSGRSTVAQTLKTLQEVVVLAELKISDSTATSRAGLLADLEKMRAAARFMENQGCESFPACYLIVFDPRRKLASFAPTSDGWPASALPPKVIAGP